MENKVCFVITVIGLGKVGSCFVRDFSRFLDSFRKENISTRLILIDRANVEEEDLEDQYYLRDDIGWNKAATLRMVLLSQFGKDSPCSCSMAYGMNITSHYQLDRILYQHEQTIDANIFHIILDCTNSSKTARIIGKVFLKQRNSLWMKPGRDGIRLQIILKGKRISGKKNMYRGKEKISYSQALTLSHLMLAKISTLMTDGQLTCKKSIYMDLNVLDTGKTTVHADSVNRKVEFPMDGKTLIICVGAGGTGGNFCKEAVRLLQKNSNASLLIIDGDYVEEKNCARQPFGLDDLLQNKADALRDALASNYNELSERIYSCHEYLNTPERLHRIVECIERDSIILVGCVDNHRARQVMHQFFCDNSSVLYLDSANEFSVGEIVVSIKYNGVVYSPQRSFYYPDVLTDKSPSALEQSCTNLNKSAPQHQVTNLVASHILFAILEKLFREGELDGGIVYFDSLNCFSRFQHVSMREVETHETAYAG